MTNRNGTDCQIHLLGYTVNICGIDCCLHVKKYKAYMRFLLDHVVCSTVFISISATIELLQNSNKSHLTATLNVIPNVIHSSREL